MSTTIESAKTAAERATEATAELRALLGFKELKLMSTALAEVAVQEVRSNPAFAAKLRAAYAELSADKKASSANGSKTVTKVSPTKLRYEPIIDIRGMHTDPLAGLDPYLSLKVYGKEQLPLYLDDQTLERLKAVAKKLIEQHPGTKPKSLSSKASVIEYIVKIVTSQ